MCCSLSPAILSETILYGNETQHPVTGQLIHVVGYQNKARNLAPGPNAMILPFPALPGSMSKLNIIDTSAAPRILKDMANAVTSRSRGEVSFGLYGADRGMKPRVEVFQHGIYTVVLAEDATAISEALDRVEPNRRPRLNTAIFEAYSEWYPVHGIALCCFNNKDARNATPMLWWYEPSNPDELFLPALDAHTGDVPDLNERVKIDHTIAVGSYFTGYGYGGAYVNYRDEIPASLLPFVADRVVGRPVDEPYLKNGDFYVNITSLRRGVFDLSRRDPLGVAAR